MEQRKLIIVCDEKARKYGDYLAQLISLTDDKDDEIVGVKDGAVSAVVWSEKEYKANSAQITSNQHILFIGNSKLIKEKSKLMSVVFNECHTKYSCLGKQAVLSVEKAINIKEYDDFIWYVKKYQNDLITIKTFKKASNPVPVATSTTALLTSLAAIPVTTLNSLSTAIRSKKLIEQQYVCCILRFYIDELKNFLGM